MHLKWGILSVLILIVFISMSLVTNSSMALGMWVALSIIILMIIKKGLNRQIFFKTLVQQEKNVVDIFIIVMLIGANVSMWISSGIVPSMIYYGFDIIANMNFMVFAFLSTMILSIFFGTGLGTFSTMGIAIITLGTALNIPLHILVGIVVSGTFMADKLSPISALVNFTVDTSGTAYKVYLKKMMKSIIPITMITCFIYYKLSKIYQGDVNLESIENMKYALSSGFSIHVWFLVIPVGVLLMALYGFKTRDTLLFGIVCGAVITLTVQGETFVRLIGFLLEGYSLPNAGGNQSFLSSLETGGIIGMIEVVFVIAGGVAMSVIFEVCEFIKPIIALIEEHSTSNRKLYLFSGSFSIFFNAITCDQTGGIIMPSRFLKSLFIDKGLDEGDLSEMICNSGTSIASLMPWNVNAIVIFSITGVTAFEYAPYAVSLYLAFPISIALSKYLSKNKSCKQLTTGK